MKVNFVHINTVIDDYLDFSGDSGRIDKPMLKKIANDIVTKVSSSEQDTFKVSLLRVSDYGSKLPPDFKRAVQLLYHPPSPVDMCAKIKNSLKEVYFGSGGCKADRECVDCEDEVLNIDLNRYLNIDNPEDNYKFLTPFFRPHRYKHYFGGFLQGQFHLMRYAQHNFFNADKHVGGCLNLDRRLLVDESIEYTLELPYIKTSEREGWVLIAYLADKVDEDGYRYVPNIPEVFEAINWAIEERQLYRQYRRMKDDRARNASMAAMQMKEKYIIRSREILETPDFESWSSYIDNHWRKVFPYIDNLAEMNRRTPDYYYKNINRFS